MNSTFIFKFNRKVKIKYQNSLNYQMEFNITKNFKNLNRF